MQEKARVVAIKEDIISVIPLDIEACMGCSNAECKRNGNVFFAKNKKNLGISIGSEVRIVAPLKNQLLQAFLAIGIPVFLAAAVFALIASFFPSLGEGARVGGALLALCGGMIFMYWILKATANALPEIVEVY